MWLAIMVLVFLLAMLGGTLQGEGWFWAFGNSLGLVAFVLLLILGINGRGRLGRSIRHRWLGLTVFIAVIAHCLWFLIGDSNTLEYLQFGAPHYMIAGLFSACLTLLLTITSLASNRSRSYNSYSGFRTWHRWLSIAIIFSAFIHIVLSGLYFAHYWRWALLALLSALVYFLPSWISADYSFQRRYMVISGVAVSILFVLLRAGGLN